MAMMTRITGLFFAIIVLFSPSLVCVRDVEGANDNALSMTQSIDDKRLVNPSLPGQNLHLNSQIPVSGSGSGSSSYESSGSNPRNNFLVRRKRFKRDASDVRCKSQETAFLSTVKGIEAQFDHKFEFNNETKFTLSLTWAQQANGEPSIIVVFTHEYLMGMFAQKSTVYRSTDNGNSFQDIDKQLPGAYIRKNNGILKNPLNAKKVMLVAHPDTNGHSPLWLTEDGGADWQKYVPPFQLVSPLIYHPKQENWQLTLSSDRSLYLTTDGGKNWSKIKDKVVKFKWALENGDKIIYALHDPSMSANLLGQMATNAHDYSLLKTIDLGHKWQSIHDNVYTFGSQGKFLYASLYINGNQDQRKMKVSTTEGNIWNEVQLPTITADRFYSILDMSEGLVFMHVDAPGDTGHGTLYSSDSTGVIFSESLDRHLYPNYEDVTDFYKVLSLRGVYMASQLSEDNSVHSVITFDRGASWQPVRRPAGAPCKDESKACNLQIHNAYSQAKHIPSFPPLSIASAPGIIMVHGHVAESLQTSPPDVYVTSDGGYNWIKALDGPHHYQIADNGGLLMAIEARTRFPDTVKFSTDEGRCWHFWKFTNQSIAFTGLLTEPGNKAMRVGIWGFGPTDHIWKIHLVDFSKIITKPCDSAKDYEPWRAHSEMSHGMNPAQQGCLLGQRETFMRLKLDSWCQNGESYVAKKAAKPCDCYKDDYECDFGYYRPLNKMDCIKRKNEKDLILCLKGNEEELKSAGYRKIPGDKCAGGFIPGKDQYVNMHKACTGAEKFIDIDVEDNGAVVHNGGIYAGASKAAHDDSSRSGGFSRGLIVFICIVVVIAVIILAVYFVKKVVLHRRRDVTYKYSLLQGQDNDDYGGDFDTTMVDSALYNDAEVEVDMHDRHIGNGTVNGVPSLSSGPIANGRQLSTQNGVKTPPKHQSKSKSRQYHDDSDDDLLE